MKNLLKTAEGFASLKTLAFFIGIGTLSLFMGCGKDDSGGVIPDPDPIADPTETDNKISYNLGQLNSTGISGTAKFTEMSDGSVKITLALEGTSAEALHPAHIHDNTAVEGGDIAISLTEVDGATGLSETIVTEKSDGTSISYQDLIDYDGYINVHLSADELNTVVAQGDIGQNALTGESILYELGSVDGSGVSGTLSLQERANDETLAILQLQGTSEGSEFPAHIHANTSLETGEIIFTFTPVDGTDGMSMTNISTKDEGSILTYSDLLEIDGYVNIHLSEEELGTIIAQGDIGQNKLTGESTVYTLEEIDVAGINGTVTFYQRINEETLIDVTISGATLNGNHPSHIHIGSVAEAPGDILITLNDVDENGRSKTNVKSFDDGQTVTYTDLIALDGYVNIHLSEEEPETIVAQGDIGGNVFTGENITYELGSIADPSIFGTATFYERKNGSSLVVLELEGTPEDLEHPTHIHSNTAAEGGGIVVTLKDVAGTSGVSQTNISENDDGMMLTYQDILDMDAYINVHLSSAELGTIIAQGDIGQNKLTGESTVYTLEEIDVAGINGTVTFYQRINEETLIDVTISGATLNGNHPSHIHIGSVAEAPGDIIITLNDVDENGRGKTNVKNFDDGQTVTYSDLIALNGYLNVHLSDEDLATILAQGNIGASVAD